ncbi:hypothetical protein KP509_27G017600 [Ceratopteris richardii]|nr:hypothetical protein KP509_27G017600 [Ceratopteris richardii]
MPVFQNGSLILRDTLGILLFIDSINEPLGGISVNKERIEEWMRRINAWEFRPFTLSNIPIKMRTYFGRFKRRVIIAKMARNPSLASNLRGKLQRAYATEEMMNTAEILEGSKRQLQDLLDMAEQQLESSPYLVGESFTMADVMFIPVLGWLELLSVDKEYIHKRKNISCYWDKAKRRASYKLVIGKHFGGLNKYKTFLTTTINVSFRTLTKRY